MARRSLTSAQIERWAKELVDLTRRNSLLYFKHLRASSFGFKQSASLVQRRLGGSGAAAGWSFYLPEPPADDDLFRNGFAAMEAGADALYTVRGLSAVGPLAEKGIPVMGHAGLVPRFSTWTVVTSQ